MGNKNKYPSSLESNKTSKPKPTGQLLPDAMELMKKRAVKAAKTVVESGDIKYMGGYELEPIKLKKYDPNL